MQIKSVLLQSEIIILFKIKELSLSFIFRILSLLILSNNFTDTTADNIAEKVPGAPRYEISKFSFDTPSISKKEAQAAKGIKLLPFLIFKISA